MTHQQRVNQSPASVLPLVFSDLFWYHFELVQTLQESDAKTGLEMQENLGEGGVKDEALGRSLTYSAVLRGNQPG